MLWLELQRDGETPLMALCSGGHLLMLRALLAYGHGGVDCNLTNKVIPYSLSCIVSQLHSHCLQHGCTALMKACQSATQQQEVLELLLLSEHLDISKQNMVRIVICLLDCMQALLTLFAEWRDCIAACLQEQAARRCCCALPAAATQSRRGNWQRPLD